MRKISLCVFCFVLSCFFLFAEERHALVIGNSAYEGSPLKNPVQDSNSVAQVLTEIGFETTLLQNATKQNMLDAIKNFSKKAEKSDTVLFYYAGHGIENDGINYLLPIDVGRINQDDAPFYAISLDYILEQISYAKAKTNIMILDSCRDNPMLKGSRSLTRGLVVVQNPPAMDSFIMYATAPGQTASDGDGVHSPFTESFLNNIKTPNIEIEQLAKKIRQDVRIATKNTQDPWTSSNLSNNFYFVSSNNETNREETDVIDLNSDFQQPINEKENINIKHRQPIEIPAGYIFLVLAFFILLYKLIKAKKIKIPNLTEIKNNVGNLFNGFGKMAYIKGQGVTSDFLISRKLVTFKDWNVLTGGKTGSAKDKNPVCKINWYEAIAYCNLLSSKEKLQPYYNVSSSSISIRKNANGYRLPTEVEWILAATNGKINVNLSDKNCWYNGNSGGKSQPICKRAKNENGIYDMYGNVYEWCWDEKNNEKVVKGGCFKSSLQECSAYAKKTAPAKTQSLKIGFRVAKNV